MTEQHHHDSGHEHPAGECDTTGRHGMLVFGEDPLYLSHLPMYACPHHFQGLFEVEFDDATREILAADRAQTGDGLYTFDPGVFPLAELDPTGGPVRTVLRGTLVRGHFERGGTPIARRVRADVRRVVRFRELDIRAEPHVDDELRYLCFGHGDRPHLVHELRARPSFDHVLAVRFVPGTVRTLAGAPLSDDVSAFRFDEAQEVRFNRNEAVEDRLSVNDIETAAFTLTRSPSGSRGFTVQLEVERERYLEINELA